MSRFTIFVGGVHGVGKNTFCRKLQNEIICDYISASKLLNWNSVNKEVENVEHNQHLLSILLPKALQADKSFVINGHFALWNKHKECLSISLDLFKVCSPNVLVVIEDDPFVISKRLRERDGVSYNVEQIKQLQCLEHENADLISKQLGIPCFFVASSDEQNTIEVIKNIKGYTSIYTRDNIYSDMLKTVIIRFDYTGATDLREFVNEIKKKELIKTAFNNLQKYEQRQVSLNLTPQDLDSGSLPTAQSQNSPLYRFYNCKYDEGLNVILDISSDFVCLTIDCRRNYHGSKRYTELVANLILELKCHDAFISINRIGIRKIDAQVIEEGEHISDYFNENFLAAKSWNMFYKNKVNYTDFFKKGDVNFNVVQHIDRIKDKRPRVIYDVDAYIADGDINKYLENEESLIHFLNYEMQDKMFELFVSCVSKSYLEKCKK